MFGGNSVMLSHILLKDRQAVAGIADNWVVDGYNVLWPM